MSAVYKAEGKRLHRLVALKFLPEDAGGNSDPRDRATNLSFRLLILKPGSILRYFLFSFAIVAAFLFLTLPVFSQETQKQPPSDPAAVPIQDKTGDQPSAQNNSQNENSRAQQDTEKNKDDRMFYVMPNFLTVDNESQVKPISWKEKFAITARGAFDPYEFAIVGVVAGIRQAGNAYPGFGQGMAGYGKRYGAAFADQVDGNIMVGGVFPSILRTDPRYFRSGKGGLVHRFGYAISRLLITRRDSGGHMFNVPEFAGNATAIAISNLYYPAADRGFSTSFTSWGVQMGIDAFGNELKEFWPDIHKRLRKSKSKSKSKSSHLQ
ncbi:MAG: hypothetical protein WB558_08460 [Terriglobales bacterium]